ncbi:MAG: hypothetical protein SRB2_01839 [Desulfobacteraceae bacterium Eth-SRB2]|nr:MAG: hypothetical protein SRB2_01839 [Desulfobacteraceae bacterium Eth-SRB2]
MSLFCPVTGYKVFSDPEWINQKVSDTLIANFWIIGNSIVYSLPKGRADLKGVRNSLALKDKIAGFVSGGNGPYIQIQDYSFLRGSSTAARRYFTTKTNNDKCLSSMIFCNLSPPLSIAVKIGRRFNTTGKDIHVARHYQDAAKLALELSGQKDLKTDRAPIDLCKCFKNKDCSLSPFELLSEDAWNIRTPEYSSQAVVIDRCILHVTSKGYLEPKHIPLMEHVRYLCQSAIPEDFKIKYIVVDSSRLKGASRSARSKFMQSIKSWHQRFPLRMYISYGANTFMRTAMHLGRPFMSFNVKIAKDIDHAFELIRDDRSGDFSKTHAIQESEKTAVVTHEDIGKLMAIIGSINWQQEGLDNSFDMDEDHPFYFLCQSIKLVKEELDDLFKERRRFMEQLYQSRKIESIGTMAGGIAHDINNILGIILGNTELAMDDVPEYTPVRLNLEEVKTASLRGKDVVRQLLSFARKTNQERKPVKINPIVTEALKLLRSSIPTSIEIRSNIPSDSAIVLADPTQINQIMINLCTNAAHAMEEDSGVLEINLNRMTLDESTAQSYELSPGGYVKLTVNDTGHGIDPEIKDRIFDPYFTTREVGKGSGMGLSMVHGIVMTHDGAITVDSEVGKGTTFNVFLPMVEREFVPEIIVDEDLPAGNEKLLLVDDEESIVKMGHQRLERLGYKIESTTSSIEALELFRSKPDQFDLVITDLTMPKMTGDRLLKKIRNIRSDIPIILCTGFSEKMDKDKAKELGATGYLEKPHDKRELAKMVREVLDGKNE